MPACNSTIQIVISTDQNYLPHAATTIASILHHMADDDRVSLSVLHLELSDTHQQRLKQLEQLQPDRCQITCVQVDQKRFEVFPDVRYLSNASYYRLIIHDLFPDLERMIYLDSDLLVRTSLAPLWNTSLDGVLAAVVEETQFLDQVYQDMGLNPGVRFNAGMMLCHLAAWRQESIWDQYIQALELFRDHLHAGDQDILNHTLAGRVHILPQRWNLTTSIYKEPAEYRHYDAKHVLDTVTNPAIVHFTSSRKPWMLQRDRHGFSHEYWRYLALTPWRSERWRGVIKRLFYGRKKQAKSTYEQLRKQDSKANLTRA
ncbi:MAG TPA: hypothetical protein DCM28_12570 [Phycisphaerales bacterium]|nr:hypothetical protein [Phycisphaerales bacterium]HCD32418.1 hypothetical protein [Phycisphaerales bacterium]|tara:strand:+ start:571 stop:1515 length:945 start_codon:yes stop_codon:yes gene_type:complete